MADQTYSAASDYMSAPYEGVRCRRCGLVGRNRNKLFDMCGLRSCPHEALERKEANKRFESTLARKVPE